MSFVHSFISFYLLAFHFISLHSFVHLFSRSFIHSFIQWFIHSFHWFYSCQPFCYFDFMLLLSMLFLNSIIHIVSVQSSRFFTSCRFHFSSMFMSLRCMHCLCDSCMSLISCLVIAISIFMCSVVDAPHNLNLVTFAFETPSYRPLMSYWPLHFLETSALPAAGTIGHPNQNLNRYKYTISWRRTPAVWCSGILSQA